MGYISDTDTNTEGSKHRKQERKTPLNDNERAALKEQYKEYINYESNKMAGELPDSRKRLDGDEYRYDNESEPELYDSLAKLKREALKSNCNSVYNFTLPSTLRLI